MMNNRPIAVPSFVFRATARKAMKPAFQVLLLLAFFALLPSLIAQTVTMLLGADPTSLLNDIMLDMEVVESNAEAITAMDGMYTAVMDFLREKGLIFFGLYGLGAALAPVLSLPLRYGCLLALRRREFTLAEPMQRLTVGHKALGVALMTSLLTILWFLPGYAVMVLGSVLLVLVNAALGTLVNTAGMVLCLVLGIRAIFRYMLAPYVLADVPATSVMGCIRRSCEMMQHRKMELFGLQISFIGWQLLLSVAMSVLQMLLGTVVGMTLSMALELVLNLYIQCSVAAFYEVYANGRVQVVRPGDVPPAPSSTPDEPQDLN